MIKFQVQRKKENILILPKTKVLLFIRYKKRGNHLSINFCKSVQRVIPYIIENEGFGNDTMF